MIEIFSNEAFFGLALSAALAFTAFKSRAKDADSNDWKLAATGSSLALVVSILLLA